MLNMFIVNMDFRDATFKQSIKSPNNSPSKFPDQIPKLGDRDYDLSTFKIPA